MLRKQESTLQNEGSVIIQENSLQHSPSVFGNAMLNTFQTIKSHQAVQIVVSNNPPLTDSHSTLLGAAWMRGFLHSLLSAGRWVMDRVGWTLGQKSGHALSSVTRTSHLTPQRFGIFMLEMSYLLHGVW